MPQGAVSDGKHIDAFIPPDLRDMFYRHPTRPYAWNNGLDPYGFTTKGLVLYLPLWALNNGGTNSIQSVDAYKHTCDITGALWTPQGRDFDGTDDIIDCGDPAILGFTGAFTLEVWFKADTLSGVDAMVSKWNGGATLRIWRLMFIDGKIYFPLFDESTNAQIGRLYNTVLSTGQWYHIAGTYDGGLTAAALKIILNGERVDDADNSAGTFEGMEDLAVNIVVGSETGVNRFDGLIGEVHIYNRALTPQEIQRNFRATQWRYQ